MVRHLLQHVSRRKSREVGSPWAKVGMSQCTPEFCTQLSPDAIHLASSPGSRRSRSPSRPCALLQDTKICRRLPTAPAINPHLNLGSATPQHTLCCILTALQPTSLAAYLSTGSDDAASLASLPVRVSMLKS